MSLPPGMLPVAAAAATGIQVGAAMVATRYVVDQTGPTSLALLRYLIGVLCLLPFVLPSGRLRFARRDLLPIALLGIGQFGILIALLNIGLQLIPAGRAALIFSTFPLLTMLLAAALGRETLTPAKAAGVALTIAGVGLVLGVRAVTEGGGTAEWLGALAVLASAFTGALCSVLYGPYLRRYPALPVGAFAMVSAVVFLAVVAAADGFFTAMPSVTREGWVAIGFIGVSSGIAFVLWLWALGRTTPTRVTVFLSLSPATAALLGALFLGEPLTTALLLGLACVVLGLWLAHREKQVVLTS